MSNLNSPVTEFAFLNIVPPTTLETPKLVSGFLAGAPGQSSWSGHPVHLFYATKKLAESDTTPSTTVYLISGWASVQAHNEWIASPENQELMRSFANEGLMSFGGLAHLDIDFTKLSFEKCGAIVWRKRIVRRDGGNNHEADIGQGRDWESLPSTPIDLARSYGDAISGSRIHSKARGKSESGPDAGSMLKPMAEVLWSYHGRAVDEGATDEYELTAYSEGQLEEYTEEYTVIHRWDLQRALT